VNTSQHLAHPAIPIALIELPPFSAVALKVLRVASSELSQLIALSNLISSDAVFAGSILRVVNSPLYGIRVEVVSILEAMMLLGLERIKGVALTIGIRSYLRNSLEAPAIKACWRHSLGCAVIAGELARASGVKEDVAYTAGVMHDIGRLALAVAYPGQYAEFLAGALAAKCDALEGEREAFGIDHCQAGRALVARWNLPGSFQDVASRHHEPMSPGESDLLAIIRASCLLADVLGFEAIHPYHARNYENLLTELPKKFRNRLPLEPTDMAFRIACKINAIEST
jgi:putative nucleotidyltransferase with HDIG domain